jgi:hypothetical protein
MTPSQRHPSPRWPRHEQQASDHKRRWKPRAPVATCAQAGRDAKLDPDAAAVTETVEPEPFITGRPRAHPNLATHPSRYGGCGPRLRIRSGAASSPLPTVPVTKRRRGAQGRIAAVQHMPLRRDASPATPSQSGCRGRRSPSKSPPSRCDGNGAPLSRSDSLPAGPSDLPAPPYTQPPPPHLPPR